MRRRPGPAVLLLGIPLLLAGLMTWCALPAAIADLITLPHGAVIARAKAGQAAAAADLRVAASAQLRAARWAEADRHLGDAAIALIAARSAGAGPVLRDELALRPTDSGNWLRLAAVERAADPAAARAAWLMARRTAPFDPTTIRPALATGFALLRAGDAGFVARVAELVRIAARIDPAGLAAAARERGIEPFVYASLLDDPDLTWRFGVALAGAARVPDGVAAP